MKHEALYLAMMITAFDNELLKTTRHAGGPVFYDILIKRGILQRDNSLIRKHAHEARLQHPEFLDHDLHDSPSITVIVKSKIVDDFFRDLKAKSIHLKTLL